MSIKKHNIPEPMYLQLHIGNTTDQQLTRLQQIKDAIVHAVIKEIETDGIDSDFRHFEPWEMIYLEADQMICSIQRKSKDTDVRFE